MQLKPEYLDRLNKMHQNKAFMLKYLGGLMDIEIQGYVDEVIRPAYNLPNATKDVPDFNIDLKTGEITPFERQNSLNQE